MVRGKDISKEGKKEKLSVLETIASIDQKPDKPKKGSSSLSIASSRKSKTKVAPKVSSYTYDIDLPQSEDDDDDNYAPEEGLPDVQKQCNRQRRSEFKLLEISTIRGKELLKNTSVKISHGKRYGFVGPNGMGKSTLLKLLAWRKIPVPKNIDLLLVEQEVVGDDRTALEAVVSANEELVRLQKEVAFLQNSSSAAQSENEDDDCNGDDVGEKLAELYEKLQKLESDATEAQASKILAGLGFNKEMQGRPTRSFSGGWRMRISLAMALFVQPTLLLLDEPTNHIDLRAVLWLEE
nr:abc transporter f family member 4 [Quercus suber]